MNTAFYGKWFARLWLATSCVQAGADNNSKALEIIRRADEIRSPNKPFRYTLPRISNLAKNKQVLDISMRFMKPQGNESGCTLAGAFDFIRREIKQIMLSDWYDLWFYTPELLRPMPIS